MRGRRVAIVRIASGTLFRRSSQQSLSGKWYSGGFAATSASHLASEAKGTSLSPLASSSSSPLVSSPLPLASSSLPLLSSPFTSPSASTLQRHISPLGSSPFTSPSASTLASSSLPLLSSPFTSPSASTVQRRMSTTPSRPSHHHTTAPTTTRITAESLAPPSSVPRIYPPPAAAESESESSDRTSKIDVTLDDVKQYFDKTIPVLALRVPLKQVGIAKSTLLREAQLELRDQRLASVRSDSQGDDEKKVILLNVAQLSDVPAEIREAAIAKQYTFIPYDLLLTYDDYSADDVLGAVLPHLYGEEGLPSSFTAFGHIAQINLREKYLPYRYLIGQTILRKNHVIRTVVNKTDEIDSEYRQFAMELVAGEADYVATHREDDCEYVFDLRTVYFNSRLHTEHSRLVETFQPGEVVVDAMAGVGPFAVPAAKKGCFVYANDLNPASYEYLQSNLPRNKVADGCRAFCEDGNAFIKRSGLLVWQRQLQGWRSHEGRRMAEKQRRAKQPVQPPPYHSPLPDHYIMNLPSTAMQFLPSFRGLFTNLLRSSSSSQPRSESELEPAPTPASLLAALQSKAHSRNLASIGHAMPLIHVYCFTKAPPGPEAKRDILLRANTELGLVDSSSSSSKRITLDEDEDGDEGQGQGQGQDESISSSSVSVVDQTKEAKKTPPPPPTTTTMTTPPKGQDKGNTLHFVRKVAPNKDMYRLSFRLPLSVAVEGLEEGVEEIERFQGIE